MTNSDEPGTASPAAAQPRPAGRGERAGRIQQFRHALEAGGKAYVEELKQLCDVQCGTEMTTGVTRVVQLLHERLSALGLQVSLHRAEGFADHLAARTGVEGKQIVLGGHLDTTYTDYGPLPAFHVDGDYAVGPGTADMKGGVVVFLAALDCLKDAGLLSSLPLTVMLNSDEERGAPTSRALFQEQAKQTKVALFSESAGPNGEIVVARRAKLSYRLSVLGEGKHAGGQETAKISALVDLAHKIIALEDLNARFSGATLNVGRAWGGIASNTVPEAATALFDIRYPAAAEEAAIRAAIEEICSTAHVPRARSELVETSYRPAWDDREVNRGLFLRVRQIAAELGQHVDAESRGGTADANWFGAAGVPCIDGLGPIGFDDHTPTERALLRSLFDRALLVATLLMTLGSEEVS